VLRRLSECSCQYTHLLLPALLSRFSFLAFASAYSSLARQLIPVSQPATIPPEVTEQPTNDAEYARLFNERFATLRKTPSRPSSAEAADAEEDEAAWLEQALGGQGEDEVDQIESTKGGLTIQFGAR
jgi:hypothetical protein